MQAKIKKATRVSRKSISKVQADPQHPCYHFAPPANWMNDPNGTIYHNGEYHLFYQFNPAKPKWGNLHWGHAKSKDLVHWEHLPMALAPEGFPGELHCWSGCCVIADDDTPTIFYTSMNPRSLLLTRARRYAQQWIATGSPDLVSWKKSTSNPILSEAIHGERVPEHWRDPYIWKEDERWLMVLCGQYAGEKFGRVFLYESQNLSDWAYAGVLATGTETQGRGWECANYFKLGEKYVLVISPYGPVLFSVGEFDGQRHHATAWHTLDHGQDFYATNTYIDDQGRTIIVGWVKAKGTGWNGCLSLPRVLELDAAHQLRISPIPELKQLRRAHQSFEQLLNSPKDNLQIAPWHGDQIEIKARFEMQQAVSFGFEFMDAAGEHALVLDFETRTLRMGQQQAKLQFTQDADAIELHIFVDHAVIEVFINNREVFTTAFYPQLSKNHALEIRPFINEGIGKFTADVWALANAPATAVNDVIA